MENSNKQINPCILYFSPSTMYKEILPADCPYADAKEEDRVLYRIFCESAASENCFVPFARLYPHRQDLAIHCKAHGLSLFDSKETAIRYAKQNPALGKWIAKVDVRCLHGKLMLTNKKTGHYTLWLYKDFNASSLNCIIETIPADAA